MNVLALCAGVGGLELGLKLANPAAKCVCYVEGEGYAAAVLVKRMAEKAMDEAPIWSDVRTFDGKPWRGVVDCITAGYPCQPFSHAGKRCGENDTRHLWPDIKRIIEEVQPSFVFSENVAGHVSLGFEAVIDDLQKLGFSIAAGLFTATEIGAPHKRERLFVLANTQRQCSERRRISGFLGESQSKEHCQTCQREWHGNTANNCIDHVGYTDYSGPQGRSVRPGEYTDERITWSAVSAFPPKPNDRDGWRQVDAKLSPAVESSLCGVADGLANRVDRLRACGNGVVPLVAAYAYLTLASSFANKE